MAPIRGGGSSDDNSFLVGKLYGLAFRIICPKHPLDRPDSYPNRPKVRDSADPLEIPDVYGQARLRLNYRMSGAELPTFIPWILSWTVGSILAVLALRAVGLWLATDFLWSLLALVVVIQACHVMISDQQTGLAIVIAASVFWLAVLVLKHFSVGAAGILFASFALLATCVLADQVATNYVSWLLANPRLRDSTVQKWTQLWIHRFRGPRGLSTYPVGFIAVGAAVLLSLVVTAVFVHNQYAGMCFVTLTVLFLLAIMAVGLRLEPTPIRQQVALTWDAIRNWFAYNLTGRMAPGLYQSPYGHNRHARVGGVIILLVLSFLPLASYFPLYMAFDQSVPWMDVAEDGWPWSEHMAKGAPSIRDQVIAANQHTLASLKRHDANLASRYGDALVSFAERSRTRARLIQTPESWLLFALRGLFTLDRRFGWALVWAIVPCTLLPGTLLFTVVFTIIGPTVPRLALHLQSEERAGESEFDCYVRRLLGSQYVFTDGSRERDHMWIGTDTAFDRPILLHRDLLVGHAHILGSTQSGKTSLALAPMLSQMIRAYEPRSRHFQTQSSIVVLDLKGDPSLFHNARLECKRRGVAFKFFTNRYGDATYAFNPFEQSHLVDLSPDQRIDMLARAMGIFYGNEYPEVFWSEKNAQVFRTILFGYPDIRSYAKFSYYASDPKHYRAAGGYIEDWKKASHVTAAAQKLAGIVPLNVTRDETPSSAVYENRIDMKPIGSRRHAPQVLYFFIRTTDEEAAAHGIAKLALYSLLTAINSIPDAEKKRTFVFIDEFQVVAVDMLSKLFEQAAGLKVSYILANQSLATLPPYLQEVLLENTAFRQFFRAGSPNTRRFIQERSGETIYDLYGITENASGTTFDSKERIDPYYRDADIVATSYDQNESWVETSTAKGYTNYGGNVFTIRTDYHITQAEYLKRDRLAWPAPSHGTFVARAHADMLSHYKSDQTADMASQIRRLLPPTGSAIQEPAAPSEPAAAVQAGGPPGSPKPVKPHPEFDQLVRRFEDAHAMSARAVEQGVLLEGEEL